MKDFVKLYRCESLGQVLVVRDTDDDNRPAVLISIKPPCAGLGVCTLSINFDDSDEGHEKADNAFDVMTASRAIAAVESEIAQPLRDTNLWD